MIRLRGRNILITGGGGFIGSSLVEELINRGDSVIVFDSKNGSDCLLGSREKIQFIRGDIRDENIINTVFHKNRIDGVVHLAAVSRVIWGEEEPKKCIDSNINGTKILLKAIKSSKQKPWFIFGSSREVYGEAERLPVCEDYIKTPINIYGITKIIGENLVKKYSKEIDMGSAILRFSNVYGNERDIMDRVVPRFIISALKNDELQIHGGNQVFDFTFIDDTVHGIIKTIEKLSDDNKRFKGEDFHILTGKGTTLQDIVNIISEHFDRELKVTYGPPRDYDVEQFIGDPSKASELLDFKATTLPDQGISATLGKYKEVFNL